MHEKFSIAIKNSVTSRPRPPVYVWARCPKHAEDFCSFRVSAGVSANNYYFSSHKYI